MPQYEGPPTPVQEQATQEAVFHPDGSLNEVFIAEQFGIGAEEAMQQVSFGSYTGTVAQMLADEKCPVGGTVGKAYQEKGLEGVAEKFTTLGEMDPGFSVKITEATVQRERLKKNLILEVEIAPDDHVLVERPIAPIVDEQSRLTVRARKDAATQEQQARDLIAKVTTEEAPDALASQPQGVDIVQPAFVEISARNTSEETARLPNVGQIITHPEDSVYIPDLQTDLITTAIEPELQHVGIGVIAEFQEPIYGITTGTGIEGDEEFPELDLYDDQYPDKLNVADDEEGSETGMLKLETAEAHEERTEIVLEALAEEFNLELETMSPDELGEVTEILDSLLIDIKAIIDDPDFEIESYIASEEFTNTCIELLKKLGIDYDDESVQQLIFILVQKIEEGHGEEDNTLSIDALNRLGTWEYKASDAVFQLSVVGALIKRKLLKRHLGQLSLELEAA